MNTEHDVAAAADHHFAAEIVQGYFAWKTEPVLTDINIKIPKGLFTCGMNDNVFVPHRI